MKVTSNKTTKGVIFCVLGGHFEGLMGVKGGPQKV